MNLVTVLAWSTMTLLTANVPKNAVSWPRLQGEEMSEVFNIHTIGKFSTSGCSLNKKCVFANCPDENFLTAIESPDIGQLVVWNICPGVYHMVATCV